MTNASNQASGLSWHLVTGEYPPQTGGVADYTQQIARALSDVGERVHVWAPGRFTSPVDGDIVVHQLPDFGPRGLRILSDGLCAVGGHRRVLVQYAPNAFGFRGMNLAFAAWIGMLREEEVWVHFHEVAYGFSWRQPPQRNFLAIVEWVMAQILASGADRVLISVPGWRHRLGKHGERADVLAVPSNLPTSVASEDVQLVKQRIGLSPLVGHFGTYAKAVADLLEPALVSVLRNQRDALFVLLGRGGAEFATALRSTYPDIAGRVFAPKTSDPTDISRLLAACDVLLQPYPDGISGRRTSAMAGLALGRPMVTTSGYLTENDWAGSGAVLLTNVKRAADLSNAVVRLLSSKDERDALGERARSWYLSQFSIEQSLAVLGVGTGSGRLAPCRSAP